MKILSINPNDGLRHCTPGTIPPRSVCLGEAEIEGKKGAILKTKNGCIFQIGENCMSVSIRMVEIALDNLAIETEMRLQNRFFNAIFGGKDASN